MLRLCCTAGRSMSHFMLQVLLQHRVQHKSQILRYTQTRAGGRLAQTKAARVTQ